jgi:hypothetical protein
LTWEDSVRRDIGTIDRIIRVVVGLGVLALYGALEPPEKYLSLLGLIPLGTTLTGVCPLYALLGISTCRVPAGPAGR